MKIYLQLLVLNTVQFYEMSGNRLDSKRCKLADCVWFELMLTRETIGSVVIFSAFGDSTCIIIERFSDNEQWIEMGKGCGSDQNRPSCRYSAGHNIMPTIGTVTVQD
jgi:hypothetical protein